MKKSKLFGLALVATMMGASFSACSNDAEEVLAQESEIRLTSEINPSRVTSDLQSEHIADGQKIGVTITGSKSGNDYVNKLWTSDGEGGLSTTSTVYWANTDINVIAYHPYNEGWTSETKTFTVSTDQSVETNYLNSDLLFATSSADVENKKNAISLTFSHKLAKINVTLQPEYQEMDLSSAVIGICNTKTSTTINLSDGTVPTEATGNVEEITAGTGKTASAIVAPQTMSSGTKFIKVVLDTKTFYYTLPTDKQLKSGYSHNYTLTVKETALELTTSSEIKDWTDANEDEGDAEEEIETTSTNQVAIVLDEWETLSRAYSRQDLTTPDMEPGEKVAVIDEQGKVHCFNVVERKNNKAILENPNVKLSFNSPYRIQYPYPEVTNNGDFIMALGFGFYEDTPTLDWMISKWNKIKKDSSFNFHLKHINSALIVNISSPFDCTVDEIRISAKNTCIFCIKGAFDCSNDDIKPHITTWTNQYLFPETNMEWKAGENYTLILTLWPNNYSADEYTLDIYTTDKRFATTPIDIPDLKEGQIKEYTFDDFEIFPATVLKKDVTEQERNKDLVTNTVIHNGETYR